MIGSRFSVVALFLSAFVSYSLSANANALSSPYVSGNALFLYRNSSFGNDPDSQPRNGMDIQEAELAFYSDVDPYSRLTMLLTVHPEYTTDTTRAGRLKETWAIEPEELYADTLEIPNFTLRVGKFKAAFGKHNQLHTHAFPFIDAPLTQIGLLEGEDGLNDVGVSAAYLLPIDKWYSELTLQYLRGEDSNSEFDSSSPNDGVSLVHWKNLADLNDDLTIEIGASYAGGKNQFEGSTTIEGADLTFRWRPSSGGMYHSWIIGSEYMQRKLEIPASIDETGKAFVVWGQYQFAERWASLARYDALFGDGGDASYTKANALANDTTRRGSLAVVFNASEFSSFKLQVSDLNGPHSGSDVRNEKTFFLQGNFTIGAHPAHAY